jgi:hypothetical protein
VYVQAEVREFCAIARDDEDAARDSLENLNLPYDERAAEHDETTFVAAAEAAGLSTSKNRGVDASRGHGDMMTEAHLGRLLPACLHQAISDVLPDRLDYYEEWLSPDGLRDGSIGLAPVSAVLGFLRTEHDAYPRVMDRAGTLAANWTVASLPPFQRRLGASLPLALRVRFGLRVARRIVRYVMATSSASTRLRRGTATMRIQASVFCKVREPQPRPLCDFYAAVAVEALRSFDVAADAKLDACRATSGNQCVVTLRIVGATRAAEPAQAA